jgi:S1-C subfamily serine protease
MQNSESNIIATIAKVMPAVVSIVITKPKKDVEAELARMTPKKRGKKIALIPQDKIDAQGMVEVGGGSGFIVSSDGIILTNKHVIAEINAKYTVITSANEHYDATVAARDPIDDIAILKIMPRVPLLPTLPLGNSRIVQLGQTVLAFGNALGIFQNTVSLGIISGLSRAVSAQEDPFSTPQEMRGLIQTDAAINPGNSGGPLVNCEGRAIGINAAVVFGAQNINFAIPIHLAERDLRDLKQHGAIRRPLLGIRYLMITPDIQEKLKLPYAYGALVTKQHDFDTAIIPESPAARAGIHENDIVLTWNHAPLNTQKSIPDYLEECAVGDTVILGIARNGIQKEYTITLAERK